MSSVKDEVLIAFINECERTETQVTMANFIYWLFENYNLTKK
jgi:hypothetical protein